MTSPVKRGISALAFLFGRAAQNPSVRRMLFNGIRLRRTEIEPFSQMEEIRFLAYCFLNRHESRSQILQDLWVAYELGERRGGFFVEFGATDGVANSNTWLLEEKYGWNGILAEPNPLWHAALAQNRKARIDRRCVTSSSGETVRFLATDAVDPELSGLAEFAGGDHFAKVRSALIDHGAPARIDYLSIDTEGSEFEILRTLDFSRYAIDLISVEQNKKTEASIDTILTSHGYKRVFREFSQWDGWYVHAERGQAG